MNDLTVRPEQPMELSVDQLMSQVAKIQNVMAKAMKVNEHYGVIPGTTGKPTLLKPGAEKLSLTFRLAPTYKGEDAPRDLGNGHREYILTCTLTHIPTGQVFGEGVGSCSTMESKYRWRRAEPTPTGTFVPKAYWDARKNNPAAAQEMLGGKDYVASKIDGVWQICLKSAERVENTDIADQYNTVLKMAKKRAHVDATLTALAASDIFTQDVEDMHEMAQDAPQSTNAERPNPTPQPATGPSKSARSALGDAILAHTNGHKDDAKKILMQLTGKGLLKDLTEQQASVAHEKFNKEYPPGPPIMVPDDDDDLPAFETGR